MADQDAPDRLAATVRYWDDSEIADLFQRFKKVPSQFVSAFDYDTLAAEVSRLREENKQLQADGVEWVVNDNAELGVRIVGQCFFLYKGASLVYEDARHDDDRPMYVRPVGKREFGESCHPVRMILGGRLRPLDITNPADGLVHGPGDMNSSGTPIPHGGWTPLSMALPSARVDKIQQLTEENERLREEIGWATAILEAVTNLVDAYTGDTTTLTAHETLTAIDAALPMFEGNRRNPPST